MAFSHKVYNYSDLKIDFTFKRAVVNEFDFQLLFDVYFLTNGLREMYEFFSPPTSYRLNYITTVLQEWLWH